MEEDADDDDCIACHYQGQDPRPLAAVLEGDEEPVPHAQTVDVAIAAPGRASEPSNMQAARLRNEPAFHADRFGTKRQLSVFAVGDECLIEEFPSCGRDALVCLSADEHAGAGHTGD